MIALAAAAASAAAGACGQHAPAAPVVTGKSTCEGCHAAVAAEWRSSFHRRAFVDDTFQTSLALEEPKEHAFCTRCHAPAAARAGVEAGVDCLACHGDAPHERRTADSTNTCAGCHEFAFDDGRPDLVQKTLSEHAASDYAAVTCAQCHMASRDGHRDHRFMSGHAPERIAAAVHVEVSRDAPSGAANDASVRVSLRVDAGHAFPTGDMFRRARLLVFAEGSRGEIVASAERIFGRTWTAERDGAHAGRRKEESDTRVKGSWQGLVELDEPSAPIARVRWTLLYERVVAVQGPHVRLAASDVVAEGSVPW